MKRNALLTSKAIVAAALAAGAAGVANADRGRFDAWYEHFDGPAWHTKRAPAVAASTGHNALAMK